MSVWTEVSYRFRGNVTASLHQHPDTDCFAVSTCLMVSCEALLLYNMRNLCEQFTQGVDLSVNILFANADEVCRRL